MQNFRSPRLKAGDTAPFFSLPDPVSNNAVTLTEFAGENVIIVFFRGTWCPFCRQQMAFLRENHAEIAKANIRLIGIVCQNKAAVRRYLQQNPLPFPLLADETRRAAKAYGAHYWLSFEGVNLAQPSLFILDSAQRVTFAHVGRHMGDLPVTYVLEKFIGLLSAENAAVPAVPATSD